LVKLMWDACTLTKDAPLDAKGVRFKRTGQYKHIQVWLFFDMRVTKWWAFSFLAN